MRATAAWTTLALLLLTGCGKTRECKPGTIFVTVKLQGAATAATTIDVTVTVDDGGLPQTATLARQPGDDTESIEVTFPSGYPRDHEVTVDLVARAGSELARQSGTVTLAKSCGTLTIELGVAADLASGDGPTPDGGAVDLTPRDLTGVQPDDLTAVDLQGCVPQTACPADACGEISDGCTSTIQCASACQLNAVSPPFASAGDTIVLDGRFGASAVVTFPGGATANATVLGSRRATVVVPATAGEGQLAVATAGGTTRSLPFRRVAYTVELQPFSESFPQVEYGREPATTVEYRNYAAHLATDRSVWLFGGFGEMTSIERAMVNADGTIGRFVKQSSALVVGRDEAAAVRIGNFVYVLGGRADTRTSISSVERAPILGDGTLGAFALVSGVTIKASVTVGPTTYTGRYRPGVAVVGDRLYLLGGVVGDECNSPTSLDSIEAATINQDGTISDFELLSATLPAGADAPAIVVRQSRLFVAKTTTVWSATIDGTGGIGAFADTGQAISFFAQRPSLLLLGDKLFALSAGDAARASFMTDGSLGPFANLANTPPDLAQTYRPVFFTAGNYLYATGFGDVALCGGPGGVFSIGVVRAPLGKGDALSVFADDSSVNLTKPRSRPAVAVVGPRVYVIGGQSTATDADVEMATVRADGSLSTFTAQAGKLTKQREGAAAAVVNDKLYVIGGDVSGTANTVEVATINGDGTLGAFATATVVGGVTPVTMSTGRVGFRLVVVHQSRITDPVAPHDGERLCAIGDATTVQCATLDEAGRIKANFANVITSAPSFGNPVFAMVNDTALFGGDQSNVQRTTISSAAGLGTSFSIVNATGVNIDAAASALGFSVITTGGRDVSPPGNNAENFVVLYPRVGTGATIGDIGTTTMDLGSTKFGHLYHASFQLGNRLYLVGGFGDVSSDGITEFAEWR